MEMIPVVSITWACQNRFPQRLSLLRRVTVQDPRERARNGQLVIRKCLYLLHEFLEGTLRICLHLLQRAIFILGETFGIEPVHIVPRCSQFWAVRRLTTRSRFEPPHCSLFPRGKVRDDIFAGLLIFPLWLKQACFAHLGNNALEACPVLLQQV